jgi:hypothetical protein
MKQARSIVRQVCAIAGQPDWVDYLRDAADRHGLVAAIANHDTAVIFDWLMWELSFQGISDAVAAEYIDRHGNATWVDIADALATNPECGKLEGYWAFTSCGYRKGLQTCAAPDQFAACPLPRHPLRNGRLNQTAYSLFLFIRDVAGGDIVQWIDHVTAHAANRNVYGISDKAVGMALAGLLIGAGPTPPAGSPSARRSSSSTLSSTTSYIAASSIGLLRPTSMAVAATPQADVQTSWSILPRGSMPANSIRHSRRCFPGSSSIQSGATAPRRASTFVMAIRSTIAVGARTCGAACTADAIAAFCAPRQKSLQNR